MRSPRGNILAAAAAAALALSISSSVPPAAAHQGHHRHGRVAPARRADGLSGSALLAQAWVHFYETPTTSPSPQCLYGGRTGKVLIAGSTEVVCTVKRHSPVMYFFGGTCDTASPPPFFAVTAEAQRRCARQADLRLIESMHLRIDGGPDVAIRRPRFELSSGQRSVLLPADNINGAPAGPATFTAHAWAAFAEHLSLGRHTTFLSVGFTNGDHDVVARTIRVVR